MQGILQMQLAAKVWDKHIQKIISIYHCHSLTGLNGPSLLIALSRLARRALVDLAKVSAPPGAWPLLGKLQKMFESFLSLTSGTENVNLIQNFEFRRLLPILKNQFFYPSV